MYDIIIIGSGPSGLTAAVYTARASLKTLVLAGKKWGGQLMLTTEVENFPGFPKGIQGPQLMMNMRKQAERFGAEIIDKDATEISLEKKPFGVTVDDVVAGASPAISGDKARQGRATTYQSRSIIIATGADTRWLGVPGEDKLIGKGVSSCAPCDAFFYKEKKVVVVGGGDSAMEEANVLTKFAKEVIIVHRRDQFRASQILQDKVFKNPKIKIIWNTEVVEILGDGKVEKVRLRKISRSENEEVRLPSEFSEIPVDGVFVAIGHIPNSSVFKEILDIDEKGYISRGQKIKRSKDQKGKPRYLSMTAVEGVFVAGDVWDYRYQQAVTAAGYGCEAALDAERWLEDKGSVEK